MKNLSQLVKTCAIVIALFVSIFTNAQDTNSESEVAVLNIDSKGLDLSPEQLGSITRTEFSKLNKYQVMDIYDINFIADKKSFSLENCYGKICLLQAAKMLETDKILTGSVEAFENKTIVTMRIIDVKSETIEKTQVIEFIKVNNQVQTMISLTLKTMFDVPVDEKIMSKLTKPFDYESSINTPEVNQLNLSGPRMGFKLLTGEISNIYKGPLANGGFDSNPFLFQFGYQFEIKYLNEGDFQALFEILPTITGLDQGKFIPSISFLNGLRSNRFGWEIAFGPAFSISKQVEGIYDAEGNWYEINDYINEFNDYDSDQVTKRLDSRGEYELTSGFLIGAGKTIKSGRLNIPINIFMIPGKNGNQFGISMGFNATKYSN